MRWLSLTRVLSPQTPRSEVSVSTPRPSLLPFPPPEPCNGALLRGRCVSVAVSVPARVVLISRVHRWFVDLTSPLAPKKVDTEVYKAYDVTTGIVYVAKFFKVSGRCASSCLLLLVSI